MTTCFRGRGGKNASGGFHRVIVKYRAHRTDGRYLVAAEMKSPTRDANDFFETVILLYDRPFFFHARTGSGRVYLIRLEERIAKEERDGERMKS